MRRLATLSTRSLLRRKGRYALTAIGIALGVAIVFAVIVTSATTNRVLERAIRGVTGSADAVATGAGTFDTSMASDVVRDLSTAGGVERAVPFFRMQATVYCEPQASEMCGGFTLFGVSVSDARGVHEFELAEGRVFRRAREVVIGPAVASRLQLQAGDRIRLEGTRNEDVFTVSGVLEGSGAGLAFGGWIAYTSPDSARRLAGAAPDAVDRVDLVLSPGVDMEQWLAENREAYAGRVLFEPASNVMRELQTFLTAIQGALTVIAGIAVFVGAFLIFLTFSVAVSERTRLYGTLRALGALPRQIRRLVVAEAATLGAVGGIAGVALGWLLARGSLRFIDRLLVELPPIERVEAVAPSAITTAGLGLAMSVVAAYVPARRAGALTPIRAMRESGAEDERPRLWWRAALALTGIGVLVFGAGSTGAGGFGSLLLLLGVVLLLPAALPLLARVVGLATRRLTRGVGQVGVMHLVKERSRSAYTLGLIMVVLAAILAIAMANRSMSGSLDRVVDEQFGSDLQVFGDGALFDDETTKKLAAMDGIEHASEMRFGVTQVGQGDDGRQIFLVIIDPRTYFETSSFPWTQGDDERAKRALESGGSILMDEPTAEDLGMKPGDEVVVHTREGPRPFEIAATYTVFGQGSGIVASLEDGRRFFGANRPMGYFVDLSPGRDADAMKERIRSALDRPGININSSQEAKAFARGQLGGYFSIAYAILAVAAIIGILGLANTLIVSVLQRTRELGILRSVGVLRRQLQAMVVVESTTLVLVAYLLALPLGWVLARLTVRGFAANLGFTVELVWWWSALPVLLLVALLAGWLAALAPARRAGRIDVVEALRFD